MRGSSVDESSKSLERIGGRDRARTGDPLLAKNRGQNTNSFV
jgi:hypothetical protein